MRLRVDHATHYRFTPPKRGVVQSLRLTPSACEGQTVLSWSVEIEGALRGAAFRDGAGDWIETATVSAEVEELSVLVRGEVETVDTGGILRGHRERVPPMAYLRESRATRPDRAIEDLAESAVSGIDSGDVLTRAHALARLVTEAIAYCPGETEHATTAAEAFALGKGVCQDHAHVLCAAARVADIPARYVTGYLFASDEDGGHEASHAWAELHIAGLGWVGFDPANAVCPDDRYIRIGSGIDAQDAAPIRGIGRGIGDEALDVSVAVDQVQQ